MSTASSDSPAPRERIEADLKTAMKARDSERLQTLRMLLTSMSNHRIETGEEVSDGDFTMLVKRAAKQRRDAADQYRSGDRLELAEKEERELQILQEYLPEPVDEEVLRAAIAGYVAEQGLSGGQAMGQVMKAMMQRFGDSADGKTLSGLVRQALGL